MSRANEPAYPAHREMGEFAALAFHGLTIREYFAGLAMQGVIRAAGNDSPYAYVAADAVAYADALIAELAKVQK